MLEENNLKDPLIFHFMFVKRQAIIISGFLDTKEFSLLKDYVSHCVVHESLQTDELDLDPEAGINFLSQLFDSESEDLLEGDKNVVFLYNASIREIRLLSEKLSKGWVVNTSLPAVTLAKQFETPVFDLKTLSWLNFDPSFIDLKWEQKLLDSYKDLALRVKIKEIYHDAMKLAMFLINGEHEKLKTLIRRLRQENSFDKIIEMLPGYFFLDGKDLLEGYLSTDIISERGDLDISMEASVPSSSNGPRKSTGKIEFISAREDGNRVESDEISISTRYLSEYTYLAKNQKLKKAFIRILDNKSVQNESFIDPLTKYTYLRTKGEWKDGLDDDTLMNLWLMYKEEHGEPEGMALFRDILVSFNLANDKAIDKIMACHVHDVIEEDSQQDLNDLVIESESNEWLGLPPLPRDKNVSSIIKWMNASLKIIHQKLHHMNDVYKEKVFSLRSDSRLLERLILNFSELLRKSCTNMDLKQMHSVELIDAWNEKIKFINDFLNATDNAGKFPVDDIILSTRKSLV
ncbi:MAG: hypothetical protein ACTSVI_09240 [Promethearchaeota archaeon]